MMLDIIALVITSSACIFLLILLVLQRKSRLDIMKKYLESEFEKAIVIDRIEDMIKENQLKSIEGSDGFLKFVSDSREWAFKYIEDVQDAFKKFDAQISPDLEYADTYGVLSMDMPSKDALARISKSYKDLKKMLPEDMVN